MLIKGKNPIGDFIEALVDTIGRLRTSSEPARRAEAVDISSTDWTPSTDFGTSTRAIKIGTGGNLKIDAVDHGTGVTIPVFDGELLPVAATKVYRTGTTASTIVALAALALLVAGCRCPAPERPEPQPEPATCEGTQIDTTCADGAPDGTACCVGPGKVGHCAAAECIP